MRVQGQVLGETPGSGGWMCSLTKHECNCLLYCWRDHYLNPIQLTVCLESVSTVAQVVLLYPNLCILGIPCPSGQSFWGRVAWGHKPVSCGYRWIFPFTLVCDKNVNIILFLGKFCEKCLEEHLFISTKIYRLYYSFLISLISLRIHVCVCGWVWCVIFPLTCKLQEDRDIVYVIRPCFLSLEQFHTCLVLIVFLWNEALRHTLEV